MFVENNKEVKLRWLRLINEYLTFSGTNRNEINRLLLLFGSMAK